MPLVFICVVTQESLAWVQLTKCSITSRVWMQDFKLSSCFKVGTVLLKWEHGVVLMNALRIFTRITTAKLTQMENSTWLLFYHVWGTTFMILLRNCSEHVLTNDSQRILVFLIFLLVNNGRALLYVNRFVHLVIVLLRDRRLALHVQLILLDYLIVIKVDLFVILEARLAISRWNFTALVAHQHLKWVLLAIRVPGRFERRHLMLRIFMLNWMVKTLSILFKASVNKVEAKAQALGQLWIILQVISRWAHFGHILLLL